MHSFESLVNEIVINNYPRPMIIIIILCHCSIVYIIYCFTVYCSVVFSSISCIIIVVVVVVVVIIIVVIVVIIIALCIRMLVKQEM